MVCANLHNLSINNIECSEDDDEFMAESTTTLLPEIFKNSNDTFDYTESLGIKIHVNLNEGNKKIEDDNDGLGLRLSDFNSEETTMDYNKNFEDDNEVSTISDILSEKNEDSTLSEFTNEETTLEYDSNKTDPSFASLTTDDVDDPYRIVQGEELKTLKKLVCKASTESNKLIATVNGIRAPMASIFPIIIILFAGGWSDKKGLRKPCMLFPLIGEFLGCLSLFISSIFMDVLPMEFGSILERVLPSMFGGQTLMLMGVYSYLSAVTPEADRTARFVN